MKHTILVIHYVNPGCLKINAQIKMIKNTRYFIEIKLNIIIVERNHFFMGHRITLFIEN